MFEYLVAGGCSFTDENGRPNNWPVHLVKELNIPNKINVGLQAGCNEYIEQSILYTVSDLLSKGVPPEKILVGIVWTGDQRSHRHVLTANSNNTYAGNYIPTLGKNWHMMQPAWHDNASRAYYDYVVEASDVMITLRTLKHAFMLQTYFNKNNIKYFMTTAHHTSCSLTGIIGKVDNNNHYEPYKMLVQSNNIDSYKDPAIHPETKWLFDQIDRDFFLNVPSMTSTYNFDQQDDMHPTPEQSRNFVLQHIIPWLKNKGWVNV